MGRAAYVITASATVFYGLRSARVANGVRRADRGGQRVKPGHMMLIDLRPSFGNLFIQRLIRRHL